MRLKIDSNGSIWAISVTHLGLAKTRSSWTTVDIESTNGQPVGRAQRCGGPVTLC